MAHGFTRWRPDTCKCVIVYPWTLTNGATAIDNLCAVFESVCAKHKPIAPNERFAAIVADNKMGR